MSQAELQRQEKYFSKHLKVVWGFSKEETSDTKISQSLSLSVFLPGEPPLRIVIDSL